MRTCRRCGPAVDGRDDLGEIGLAVVGLSAPWWRRRRSSGRRQKPTILPSESRTRWGCRDADADDELVGLDGCPPARSRRSPRSCALTSTVDEAGPADVRPPTHCSSRSPTMSGHRPRRPPPRSATSALPNVLSCEHLDLISALNGAVPIACTPQENYSAQTCLACRRLLIR